MKYTLLLCLLLLSFGRISAQESAPVVYLMGEYQGSYDSLLQREPVLLLNICDNDMERAYTIWLKLLSDMEIAAEEKELDLRGIKIWINVFFNPDGTIKNIVYHPKPNSINLDYSTVTEFFTEFANQYVVPVSGDDIFVHYSSASFPTFFYND